MDGLKNFLYAIINNTVLVISSKERQETIINDVHEGNGDGSKGKVMASHRGKGAPMQKIVIIFFLVNY